MHVFGYFFVFYLRVSSQINTFCAFFPVARASAPPPLKMWLWHLSGADPEFDFKKRFAWSDLTSEQADYLMSDNVLTFEVIGHPAGDSSTVVE